MTAPIIETFLNRMPKKAFVFFWIDCNALVSIDIVFGSTEPFLRW